MMMDVCILGGKSREKYSDGRVISGNLVAGISQGCGVEGEKMVFKVGWEGLRRCAPRSRWGKLK